MSSLLRAGILLYFIFYALSPLSYAQPDDDAAEITPPACQSGSLRLFFLEYFFSAGQKEDSAASPTERCLLRKKKVLTSSRLNRKTLSSAAQIRSTCRGRCRTKSLTEKLSLKQVREAIAFAEEYTCMN